MKIVGLDLSLTATGIATVTLLAGDNATTPTVSVVRTDTSQDKGARLDLIGGHVEALIGTAGLLVIEDLPPGTRGNNVNEVAMVQGIVRRALFRQNAPVVWVNLTHLKMYATGRGSGEGSGKPDMLASAIRRLHYEGTTDNNAVDALWLCALGCALVGRPLVDLPKSHTRALEKLTLPDAVTLEVTGETMEATQ